MSFCKIKSYSPTYFLKAANKLPDSNLESKRTEDSKLSNPLSNFKLYNKS